MKTLLSLVAILVFATTACAQTYIFEESTIKDVDSKTIVKEYTKTVTEKFSISELEREITMYEQEIQRIQQRVSELQTKISEARAALKITK